MHLMPAEFTFGNITNNRSTSGTISTSNTQDSYTFSLSSTQSLSTTLTGLSADADIRLFRGSSINGNIERTELVAESLKLGSSDELIDRTLGPGNYIIDVFQGVTGANTQYRLDLSIDNGNNSFNLGNLNGAQTFSGTVDSRNTIDRYRFSLTANSAVNLNLGGLSNDADLYLGRDTNGNGRIDSGEQIAVSDREFNFNEAIQQVALAAGDYIAEVRQYRGDTHYRLGLSTTPNDVLSSTIDLTGVIRNVIAPDIRNVNPTGQAQVLVSNIGTGLTNARGNVRVNLYASTNPTFDSNDELLSSQTMVDLNLASGNSQVVNFQFGAPTGVAPGSYYLIARIDTTNVVGESNEANNLAVQHVSAPGTDVVLDWNATLLNAIQAVDTPPPLAAHHQAMVHIAIFDAVNAIEKRYENFSTNLKLINLSPTLTTGASTIAAAAQAAYRVLVDLYPSQKAEFDAQLARSLADVPDGTAETNGITIGNRIADAVILSRRADGSNGAQARYAPSPLPGQFEFTRPDNFALLPGWGKVQPFTIPNADRFVPSGPPIFGSAGYAADLNTVQRVGGYDSTSRTADQSEIAVFWSYDRADTFRPPAQWNVIAETVAIRAGSATESILGRSVLDNARLFAHLNIAQADAGIMAWETKFTYNQERPISAIHNANTDGNAQTIGDPNWQSFLPTPPFPDYISGHSTFGAAAATVLTSYFGNRYPVTISSQEISGTYRSFSSFQSAAAENGISRIYGGIHVPAANTDGLSVGEQVATYVLRNSLSIAV